MACTSFAAKANNRLTIQRPVETVDLYGGRTVTWQDVGTYWAQLIPLSGREIFQQQAHQSRITHRAIIRYQTALQNITTISDYRALVDSKLFGITTAINLDTDMKSYGTAYQELMLEENGPDVAG